MKSQEEYRFVVAAEDQDQAAAGRGAQALATAPHANPRHAVPRMKH